MKRIIVILAILAGSLGLAACNTHSGAGSYQEWCVSNGYCSSSAWPAGQFHKIKQNHGYDSFFNRPWGKVILNAPTYGYEAKMTLISVLTYPNGDAVDGGVKTDTSPWLDLDNMPGGATNYTVWGATRAELATLALGYIPSNIGDYGLHAYETIVEVRAHGGAGYYKCEYHDPDGSNPVWAGFESTSCKGRDANGQE